MTEKTLPAEVVETDRKLQRSADELMELRWHWTLDETNDDRVSQHAYARQVGVSQPAVNRDANAWANWLRAQRDNRSVITPGSPQTPSEYRELQRLSAERQEAVKAVARTTGHTVGTVARHKTDEVEAVVSTARERAVERGTTVEHEIERAAEWREKSRKAAQREQDEHRQRSTLRFIEIEGDIGVAMQRLRKILKAADDVAFTDEERELISESLSKMRALMNLIDLRIAGETHVDWDGELQKLVN